MTNAVKKKVLVTGATGFIGSSLVQALVADGYAVRALTRSETTFFSDNVEIVIGDLTHHDVDLEKIVAGCDVVVNCAGEIHDEATMHALHVDGTRRLLSAFKQYIAGQGHWVQLSSVGAYGPPDIPGQPRVVTEDSMLNPRGTYEITKTIADQHVMESADSLFEYTILRPSNVVGMNMPNQSFASLLGIIKKGLFFYIGSREAIATYIHVDDVVEALMLCLKHPAARNQVFNLSNDCKLADIVNEVASINGRNTDFWCLPEKPLRFLVSVFSKFIKLPLTESRIDSMVSKTTYSSKKIGYLLEFDMKKDIPMFSAALIHHS